MYQTNVLLVAKDQNDYLVSTTNFPQWHIFRVEKRNQLVQLANKPCNLIIFDASSFTENSDALYNAVRKQLPQVPLIYIIDQFVEEVSVNGMNTILQKPFTKRKLGNRAKALLPANELEEEIVRVGHITLYTGKKSLKLKGFQEQKLTPKIQQLLLIFLRNPNQVVDRPMLMKEVWDTTYIEDTRTLDVHIRWLRELIEEDPAKPQLLRTIRGVGYIFNLPSAPLLV